MRKKSNYLVSIFDDSNECVFSHVLPSRSSFEAIASIGFAVSLSRPDVFPRLKDCKITVTVCPNVEADS